MASSKAPDVLLFAAPTTSADMRWFSHFHAGDPFPAFSAKGKKIGLLPLLEVGRAKTESDFDVILNLTEIIQALRKKNPKAGVAEAIIEAARQHGVRSFTVPHDFPAGLWVSLQAGGLTLSLPGTGRDERSSPQIFPQRVVKTSAEQAGIAAGNAASAAGFKAVEKVLRASTIRGAFVRYKGKVLTSEVLQMEVNKAVSEAGGVNDHGLIIAPGDQAVDCHCAGSGPVRAHEPIVVDIFPRNRATWLYGDMTRTYVKGKASPARRRMIETVKGAHAAAFKALRAGVTGAAVYTAAANHIKNAGYVTENRKGTYVGFFHGLGHGVGYDIHEEPSLSLRNHEPLQVGHVVTVEPGLYYPGLGGCRFEDVAVVTKKGYKMLSKHPYRWEIA